LPNILLIAAVADNGDGCAATRKCGAHNARGAMTHRSEAGADAISPGVLESPCSAGSAYQFRYEGLTLILQSGNQYLLLPNKWTHDSGTAFLLPRGDGLRLEFSPAGQPLHAAC
jgi:hypothetical protein